eukprot:TRINITY_DN467_c0_g1_i1.p1 TRINITY_DN467_c0_g1~~TRINITY_DN467_c0_g1_i1.p1  ORF type:complete len:128 (-),score=23.50 TRINITY_DN467_c0_g1_i1:256-639(-)
MYAVTEKGTFHEALQLKERIYNFTEVDDLPVVLVGNKIDLEDQRKVTTEEGANAAKGHGWKFLEGSAKNKINVVEAFIECTRGIKQYRDSNSSSSDNTPSGSGAGAAPQTTSPTRTAQKPKRKCILI